MSDLSTSLHQRLTACSVFQGSLRCVLAYSGGVDSHALLHLLCVLRDAEPERWSVRAVHINHQLYPDAGEWQAHCEQVCTLLDVPLQCVCVEVAQGRGEGLEAAARDARYEALESALDAGETLLTAQHQDDQFETVLLQMMRGAGPAGLAAMPLEKPFAQGVLLRPMLNTNKEQLRQYAQALVDEGGMGWCEDHSNTDTAFDRNYLRHEVMPRLSKRWPQAARMAAKSASHCAQAQALIEEVARQDFAGLGWRADQSISLALLAELPRQRASECLRHWCGLCATPPPPENRVDRVFSELMQAAQDRNPVIAWAGYEWRRYRGRLYLMAQLPPVPSPRMLPWDGIEPLRLPGELGTLHQKPGQDDYRVREWQVRLGATGVHCEGKARSKTLKNLFQEQGVPPWIRNRMPLVFDSERLLAVPGLRVCDGGDESVQWLQIKWTKPSGEPWL